MTKHYSHYGNTTHQRIYWKYYYAVVEEMRSSKHVNTLDPWQDPPPGPSLLWPLKSIEKLQCELIMPFEATEPSTAPGVDEPDKIMGSDDEDESKARTRRAKARMKKTKELKCEGWQVALPPQSFDPTFDDPR